MPSPRAQEKLQKLQRIEGDAMPGMLEAVRKAREAVAVKILRVSHNPRAVAAARVRDDLFSRIGGVYNVLGTELDAMFKELVNTGAIDWHKEALADIERYQKKVPESVVKFDRARVETYWSIIHPDNARNLAAVFTKSMVDEDVRQLRTAFLSTWRQGELEGWTLRERHKELQRSWDALAGNKLGDRFTDRNGHSWTNARYLEMLTRTTAARVSRDSYFDTLIQNGDDLVQIENVDGEACDICAAWDGVIVSIGGGSDKYPSYQDAMDSGWGHPNCRCHAARVDETVDAAEIRKQADTPTPDFERDPEETDTEYRNRMTEAVGEYSSDFGQPSAAEEDVWLAAEPPVYPSASQSPSPAPPWQPDFPDVQIHTTITTMYKADMKPGEQLVPLRDNDPNSPMVSPSYKAAKRGDTEAAVRVVGALVKEDRMLELKRLHPDAIIVPVHAQEVDGKNKIPMAFAEKMESAAGFEVERGIVQTNVVGHTGANAKERLERAPLFAGPVQRGREYIGVDDVTTSGSTLAGLRNFIESNGGKFVRASTLATTSSQQIGYGGYLGMKAETLAALEKKFDAKALNGVISDHEIAPSIGHLTNGQGKYLLTFKDVDSIRNRLASSGR